MAKALFQQGQKVFAENIGTWATIEKVIPHWVKGVDEPIRVTYDLGLGREFLSTELVGEAPSGDKRSTPKSFDMGDSIDNWRVTRRENQLAPKTTTNTHPMPGTYPAIITDEKDWGGWRVPALEYNRDPELYEYQARTMACASEMLRLIKSMVEITSDPNLLTSDALKDLNSQASLIMRRVYDIPDELQDADMEGPSAHRQIQRRAS